MSDPDSDPESNSPRDNAEASSSDRLAWDGVDQKEEQQLVDDLKRAVGGLYAAERARQRVEQNIPQALVDHSDVGTALRNARDRYRTALTTLVAQPLDAFDSRVEAMRGAFAVGERSPAVTVEVLSTVHTLQETVQTILRTLWSSTVAMEGAKPLAFARDAALRLAGGVWMAQAALESFVFHHPAIESADS